MEIEVNYKEWTSEEVLVEWF